MRRIAVLLAVGILLAGACGDDDSDGSAGGPADGAGGDFCSGLQSVYEDMGAGGEDVGEEQGRAALERLTELDPPEEIADDWQTFVDYLQSASSGEEPDQATSDEWIAATGRLNTYAEEECGISPSGSDSGS